MVPFFAFDPGVSLLKLDIRQKGTLVRLLENLDPDHRSFIASHEDEQYS